MNRWEGRRLTGEDGRTYDADVARPVEDGGLYGSGTHCMLYAVCFKRYAACLISVLWFCAGEKRVSAGRGVVGFSGSGL